MKPDEARALRAAATDCVRAADDYEAEGFGAIAARFRVHAVAIWEIAEGRVPPRRAPRPILASCGHPLHPRGFGCTHDGCGNDSRQFEAHPGLKRRP